ncbi:unnamed protein product [Gadus morhua 'NCC']
MSPVTGGCPLALVILLLVSTEPTATAVVKKVSDCAEFFLDGKPPKIENVLDQGNIQYPDRYAPICQKYNNKNRFMTLYDKVKQIPVFSAYKYTGHEKGRCQDKWKLEPGLDAKYQSAEKDYQGQGSSYHKGHLFPCFHANSEDDQKSTFMVTNRVPQDPSFNIGGWKQMENRVKRVMDKYCLDQNKKLEAFVLTGAFPSDENMPNTKVNIPKTLWTAFCCYSKVLHKWFACAHWGANVKGRLEAKTVADLNLSLGVDPFPDKCLHTTDSELRTVFSSRPISPSSKTHVRKKAGKRPPKL